MKLTTLLDLTMLAYSPDEPRKPNGEWGSGESWSGGPADKTLNSALQQWLSVDDPQGAPLTSIVDKAIKGGTDATSKAAMALARASRALYTPRDPGKILKNPKLTLWRVLVPGEGTGYKMGSKLLTSYADSKIAAMVYAENFTNAKIIQRSIPLNRIVGHYSLFPHTAAGGYSGNSLQDDEKEVIVSSKPFKV